MNNEELYKEAMKELEEALQELKKRDFDVYLKTLGELEKDLRKYLLGDHQE